MINRSLIDSKSQNDRNLFSIKTTTDDEDDNSNGNDNKASPFQRDYRHLQPHEMLVPLEKYRPRRSNIRRSARQHVSVTKNQTDDCQQNQHRNSDPDLLAEITKEFNFMRESSRIVEDNDENNDYDDDDGFGSERNENQQNDSVDDLDPSERNKRARIKISEILRRQSQLQSASSRANHHQFKHQSLFIPNFHNSHDGLNEHRMNCNHHQDGRNFYRMNSLNDDDRMCSKNFDRSNDCYVRNNNNNNNLNNISIHCDDDCEAELGDHHRSDRKSIQLIPRPVLPKEKALFIDELKKFQSHFTGNGIRGNQMQSNSIPSVESS
ncbi:hypothetical protein QR98_0021850 [Sarcoptes scabiei]|uniref:Uncharacterized protein n=1 Tax=Sarcoptes scabiei TaxID=52283 RepID=A0A131ZYK6_SARSC|nr:hypothetical protein QR98_0021850 [Sarcoptes scabiei]